MATRNRSSDRKVFLLLLLAALAAYGVVTGAWQPAQSHAQASLSAQIERKHLFDAPLLDAFYQSRDMRPVWLRGVAGFQPRVDGVLALLDQSWNHGLNPENYHVAELRAMMASPDMNRLEFDMLLSDGVVRYARDLTGMRGYKTEAERSAKYWRQPMEPQAILEEVVLSANPVRKLHDLAPGGSLYRALQEELVTLSGEAKTAHAPVKIGAGLKPGKSHAQIPALRERLGLPAATSRPTYYDDALAAEVMKLQRAHAQKANGVLRAETLDILNRNIEAQILQVAANMERLRWIDQTRPDRYVLVNIPSASLWAVEGGKVALEMPVIVGKTARPTYSFRTEITGVRFNPNWTVPPTIKNKDFLPMLQQNPMALVERGITIRYQGREIDPTKVDWSTVTPKHLAMVRMVQNPGDDNPLGKVRVIMENPYDIYLHDTNNRAVFDKDERLLSSGCIRVADPEKLADFILRGNDGWSEAQMRKLIDSGRMREVMNEEPVPVYITYQTMWLDSEGRLVYGKDVYGQDAKLGAMLKKSGSIHILQNAEKQEIFL